MAARKSLQEVHTVSTYRFLFICFYWIVDLMCVTKEKVSINSDYPSPYIHAIFIRPKEDPSFSLCNCYLEKKMEVLTLKIKFQMPVHYQMKKILQWSKSVSDLLAETSTLTEVLHEMWKILGIVQIIIQRQEARLFAEFGVICWSNILKFASTLETTSGINISSIKKFTIFKKVNLSPEERNGLDRLMKYYALDNL